MTPKKEIPKRVRDDGVGAVMTLRLSDDDTIVGMTLRVGFCLSIR